MGKLCSIKFSFSDLPVLCTPVYRNYLEGATGQFCSCDISNLVHKASLNSSDKRYFLNVDSLHA